MWILTKFGAFMPALRPPATVPDGDLQVVQIRARRKADLAKLRERYMPDTLGPTYRVPKSDYQWRANCTHEALALTVARLALEIDYVSFKDNAEDEQLHDAYMRVWWALRDLGGRRRGRAAPQVRHQTVITDDELERWLRS
jgi:hypothetical protein